MAITDLGMEQAEYTFCYERRELAGEDPELRRLPWAFLRFRDAGEDRQYITTLPPAGLHATPSARGEIDWQPYRQFYEIMANRPFPVESGRDNREGAAGSFAVHFFSAI